MGKLLTVVYSLSGIVIALICVHEIGKLFLVIVDYIYGFVFNKMNQLRHRQERKEKALINFGYEVEVIYRSTYDDKIDAIGYDIPVSVGTALTLVWILLTAFYFEYTENWSYFDALYFTFVSLTTIGRL